LLILYTDSWIPIAKVVLPNAGAYCKRHGYDFKFICFPEPYESDFGFRKLRYIQECFKIDYGIVWSLDLDTLIINHKYKIEDFLDEENSLFICEDYNGLNCGSFVVKNTDWSEQFLKYCLEQKGKPEVYCEQNAMEDYIQMYGQEKIKILEHPSINSYLYENYPDIPPQKHEEGQWQEGDFLLHLPGIGMDKRLEILKNTPVIL